MSFYQNHSPNDCKRKKQYSKWLANGGSLKPKVHQNKAKKEARRAEKKVKKVKKRNKEWLYILNKYKSKSEMRKIQKKYSYGSSSCSSSSSGYSSDSS
jgi:hypothetical protein